MTVYVDDMKAEFKPRWPRHRYVMSHMIADTEAELHAMADKIGVSRKRYQGDHYDITQSKKLLAIGSGARLITLRQLARMVMRRRQGELLPPEAKEYNPDLVAKILHADSRPPEAKFDNIVDMLDWLNCD